MAKIDQKLPESYDHPHNSALVQGSANLTEASSSAINTSHDPTFSSCDEGPASSWDEKYPISSGWAATRLWTEASFGVTPAE